ncbi:MAG: aspartate/glutamate racemase family protein [Gammaproteobacteria bacterium]|nr:aspartate/glutamate racemase family protein [Gammaproteobacteria bacterium]
MKTLGLIGGMSWESTAHYYARINQLVAQRLGDLHSAQMLLYSIDFDALQRMQHADDWQGAARLLVDAARHLERGGADGLLICANTMHKVAPEIQQAVGMPVIHIVDATADTVRRRGLGRVALLGTRFIMEQDFYRRRLEDRYGLKVMVPDQEERAMVHHMIFDELCKGLVRPESKQHFLQIIARLRAAGAQGAILGCTEFSLFQLEDTPEMPLFDTTELHARRAVDWALEKPATD